MITRERLEELIKQGATIYSTHWKEEVDLSQKCEVVKKSFYDGKKRLVLIVHEDEKHSPHYMLENLTEDVEGAKWEEEFGCIERTERLELPTWEKFNSKYCEVKFYTYKHQYTLFNSAVKIRIINENKVMFEEDFSKDNYTLACRKVKELFLGENK